MNGNLRIAIQKSGRLSDKSVSLLQECGIGVSAGSSTLRAIASNFPLEVLYLRDDDIPQYVADGVAHIGILGGNVVKEKAREVTTVEKLGFGKCRLSLAVRREAEYGSIRYFQGKRIATSYPRILKEYLDVKGIKADIEEISGSVEIAPSIGLADGICDIVSTGSTLLTNGLREVETIFQSEAVLIAHPRLSAEHQAILEKLLFRVKAVRNAQRNKYILMNVPNSSVAEIAKLLPGIKSPTVMPLAEPGWSSLHSVVREDEFWQIIDRIKALGAEGLLVCPIEKMVE